MTVTLIVIIKKLIALQIKVHIEFYIYPTENFKKFLNILRAFVPQP